MTYFEGAADRDRLIGFTENVDDKSAGAATHLAQVLVFVVRALRIPSLLVICLPLPFIALVALAALSSSGASQFVGLVVAAALALVCAAAAWRRQRILAAVGDPDKLATELGIMISLSDRAGETRTVVQQIAGGGVQVFARLKGVWSAAGMTGRWIDSVGDLPRARYFAPPKIGTTTMLTVASLWLIPLSVVASILACIAALAGTL